MNDGEADAFESNVKIRKEFDDDPHIFTLEPDEDFTIITHKGDIIEMCPHCKKGFYKTREGVAIANLKKHRQSFMAQRSIGHGLVIFAVQKDFYEQV